MCGFFQIFSRNGTPDKTRFTRALDSIRHRGPDDIGIESYSWNNGQAMQALSGHRRLAIIDLNPRSKQPFGDAQQSLLFNGEIYNYADLRPELKDKEIEFHTTGDTEVLYEGLKSQGTDFLNKCNGMWAFTHLNTEHDSVIASRDRYGKKPLFFYQDENILCFSSTIRAIQIYIDQPLRLSNQIKQQFLTYGTMYPSAGHQTHFDSIQQVQPGSSLYFNLKDWTFSKNIYFDPTKPRETDLSDPEQLAEYLRVAVSSRLVADRPVALLLSGGIDSSLILSVLCAMNLQENIHIYIGDTGRSDDHAYAEKCVEQLGVKAKTIQLDYSERSFDRFLAICRHQEKCFLFNGSALAMPEMYENIAGDGIPVVLDGTGGDEFFGGYWNRQFPIALREEIQTNERAWVDSFRGKISKTNNISKFIKSASRPLKLTNWCNRMQPRLSTARHRYLKKPLSELLKVDPSDPLIEQHADFNKALVTDISPGGRLGEWVWHNDRNAMMSSVENRSPLLDFRFHAYLFSGYKKKFNGKYNKYELRKIFDTFNQLPTQWRWQKQGFRWNGKSFLRQNQDVIRDLICSSEWLADSIDLKKFGDRSVKSPSMLRTTLAKRMLTIAGLEESMRS
ncbi:MAG: asparagine synthase (glutamine-hydrolyzing) [Opitutaceae bacterium]